MLWDFPSIQLFIGYHGSLLFGLVVLSIIGAVCWLNFYLSVKNDTKESAGAFLKNLFGAGLATLFVFFLGWTVVADYRRTSECRNLDLNRVTALHVRKMPREDSYSGPAIIFKDAEKVRAGLKLLRNANNRERKKDRFIDGYHLELVMERPPGPISLSYFAETSAGAATDVVILQCVGDASGTFYSSPSFGNWLRETIAPAFKGGS